MDEPSILQCDIKFMVLTNCTLRYVSNDSTRLGSIIPTAIFAH